MRKRLKMTLFVDVPEAAGEIDASVGFIYDDITENLQPSASDFRAAPDRYYRFNGYEWDWDDRTTPEGEG